MQEVTIIEAVSEGPVVGLATGDARSIALNETPLMTEAGEYTYKNVSWAMRLGTADQAAFADVSGVETETSVGVEVTKYFPRASGSGSGAVSRQITNPYCTDVRITMSVGALYEQLVDQDRAGDTVAMTISYNVLIKDKDENIVANDFVERTDKTTSGAQWAKKYTLTGGAPWTVTVTKTYEDNTSDYKHNDIYWASYTEVVGYKMIYPHTACMMIRGNAETFGNSVPNRAYKVKGLIVEVPSNYDPATRQYSGIWDGTFKNAWTDNPAWVLRDIIESGRYGLKKFFPPAKQGNALCDKWTLYEIAKYCDEYVSDGSGGVEPRYTFNGQIMGSGSAREVLQSIASNFHGMMYWSSGMVIASSDVPKDPVKSLTQANIIDGNLSYSTGSAQERHSVALVTWYDPDNYGNARIEPVYDWDAYQRYGYRPINVTAYGCTSRAQAHRQGLWTLLTEDEQWQASCEVGLDGYDLMPGDFVKIADPKWMGTRFSGRIESIDGTSVTLDGEVGFASGESYVLYVVMPDGTEEHRNITSGAGTHTTITIASAFDKTPVDHAVWTISGTDVAPRLFAVRSIEETQNGRLRLSLREVISAKYTRLEQSIEFTTTPGRRPTVGVLDAPTGLTVVPANYISGGQVYQRLTFSWVGSGDSAVSEYEFGYRSPAGDWNSFTPKKTYSMDIAAAASGTYIFRVRALSLDGRQSSWAEKSYTLEGVTTKPQKPTELKAEGGYRSIKVSWQMPSDALVGYYEVFMAESDVFSEAELVGKIYGSSFDVMNLGVLETRWFWVRSVSYANAAATSDIIGPVSGTTKALEMTEIPEQSIQPSKLVPRLERLVTEMRANAEANLTNSINEEENRTAAAIAIQELSTEVVDGLLAEAEARTLLAAQLNQSVATLQQLMQVVARAVTITQQAEEPENPQEGDIWEYETGAYRQWDGAAWQSITDEQMQTTIEAVTAEYSLLLDVNGNIAGFGVRNSNIGGTEFSILADAFKIATSSGERTTIFQVDSEGNVQLVGSLIAGGSITGDKINAAAKIQLGAGGEFVAGAGAMIQIGDGAILLSGEDGSLTCLDPANTETGDKVILSYGNIQFLRYVQNEGYQVFESIKSVKAGTCDSNTWVTLPGRWKAPPTVLVGPNSVLSYSAANSGSDQYWSFYVKKIEEVSGQPGVYRFLPIASLRIGGELTGVGTDHTKTFTPATGVTLYSNVATTVAQTTDIMVSGGVYCTGKTWIEENYGVNGHLIGYRRYKVVVSMEYAPSGGNYVTAQSIEMTFGGIYAAVEQQYSLSAISLAAGTYTVRVKIVVTRLSDAFQRIANGESYHLQQDLGRLSVRSVLCDNLASSKVIHGRLNWLAVAV